MSVHIPAEVVCINAAYGSKIASQIDPLVDGGGRGE